MLTTILKEIKKDGRFWKDSFMTDPKLFTNGNLCLVRREMEERNSTIDHFILGSEFIGKRVSREFNLLKSFLGDSSKIIYQQKPRLGQKKY